jgi:hypothetical protein
MTKNVVKWVVEEVSNGEVLFEQSFDDYKDALEVYESLKEKSDSNVSLHKSTKKLLTE